jgi:hypothetical protein
MEKPKFILLEIVDGQTSQQCISCGSFLYRFHAKLKNSETNEEIILGRECFKKVTGKTLTEVKQENKEYKEELDEIEEGIKLKLKKENNIKKFIEVNKEILEWIEKRLIQEDEIYNKASIEVNKIIKEKGTLSVKLPYWRGEFWQSLINQIEEKGSLTEKQIEFINKDMTRNRETEFKLKEKIEVEGKIQKYWCTQYNKYSEISLYVQIRTQNNIDITVSLSPKLRQQLGIEVSRFENMFEIKYEVINLPEIIKVGGTISYVDPAGGKIKLTHCKIV